jgi:hypothetical protein
MSRVDKVFPFVVIQITEDFRDLDFLPKIPWRVIWDTDPESYTRKRWGDLHSLVGRNFLLPFYPKGDLTGFLPSTMYAWIMGKYDPNFILLQQPLSKDDMDAICRDYLWVFQTFPSERNPWEFLDAYMEIFPTRENAVIRLSNDPRYCRITNWEMAYAECPLGVVPKPRQGAYILKYYLLHPNTVPVPVQDPDRPNLYRVGRYAMKDYSFKIEHIPNLIRKTLNGG